MIGIKNRFGKARISANRVAYLSRKNKRAKALYGTGVLPSATYGAEAVGYSPTMIKQLRTMAADCMGSAKYGRCPITAIAIAKGPEWDPEVRGPTRLIMEWCRLKHLVPPNTLTEAWIKMEEHIAGGNQWAKVVGPMSAAYMHLKEMGWLVETNDVGHIIGVIDQQGKIWRPNDAVTWVDFQEELEKTRINTLWKKAASHRGGKNLEQGADISVAQRHYKHLVCAGKHAEAGALMTICTGACWSPARLYEEGMITAEEAVCPLCGCQMADEGHLFWECPKVQENEPCNTEIQ